jgi:hypothetical protein
VKSRRLLSVLLALGVIAAAVVWVSDVRFKDQASAWDCGVPLGAAWHGREAPLFPISGGTNMTGPVTQSGVSAVPLGMRLTTTVCAGEARARLAIAAGAILVAGFGLVLSRRRWGRSPPSPALA